MLGRSSRSLSAGRALALLRQLLRFATVGSAAAVFDFGAYFACTRLVAVCRRHYVATSFWTATLGASLSYFLNSRWTFRQRRWRLRQFLAYVVIFVGGICWQNVLLWFGVEELHLPDLGAKACAIVVVAVCWNFTLAKLLVFRPRPPRAAAFRRRDEASHG